MRHASGGGERLSRSRSRKSLWVGKLGFPFPKASGAVDDTTEEGRKDLLGREVAIPVPKCTGEAAMEADDDTTEEGMKRTSG